MKDWQINLATYTVLVLVGAAVGHLLGSAALGALIAVAVPPVAVLLLRITGGLG
jgi:hypothetical protein